MSMTKVDNLSGRHQFTDKTLLIKNVDITKIVRKLSFLRAFDKIGHSRKIIFVL